MEIYNAVIETAILVAVAAETWITWQYLSYNHKQRIRRQVSKLLKLVGYKHHV